jgi:inward rectifier potassium channel
MQKATFDPGLTQKYGGPLRRVINQDGSFNVHRRGVRWKDINPYLYLINTSWPKFLTMTVFVYLAANALFALAYFVLGAREIQGSDSPTEFRRYLNDFFFSAQTLSTVGYGSMAPRGLAANFLAAIEAMIGLMGFALATGLLFGRFSRASAKIGFSGNILIAPYQDVTALQFRIVNLRVNSLMELEAHVILMTVEDSGSERKRNFQILSLERDSIVFFPLTWTIVHPIDQQSPLHGKTAADLERMRAEVLILIKGFDDTFSQSVHARYSYRYDEIRWDARFAPAFSIEESGDALLDVDKVGELVTSS